MDFDEEIVTKLKGEIRDCFDEFLLETTLPNQKAQARRARKVSNTITRLMKEYRSCSIK